MPNAKEVMMMESRRIDGMDQNKVALFGHLLKEAFPGHQVYDTAGFDTGCRAYRVMDQANTPKHRVDVSREFLDDNDESAIRTRFRQRDMAGTIRQAGLRLVLVTNAGAQIIGG
jgi:hypothetical protein